MPTRATYEVVPKPRQRQPNARPDQWAVQKNGHTVQTFTSKRSAESRAKDLARNNNTTLAVYDSAKKSSQEFDYRNKGDRGQSTGLNFRGGGLNL